MAPRKDSVLAGHYFLGIQGLALIRYCLTDSAAVRPRIDEMIRIAATMHEFPNDLEVPMLEHDVEEGYSLWAASYDGPNPAIEAEEPIVHPMFEALPAGVALDAACGTGRHAATLGALGHRVIGVDGNEAMLAVAREKVPAADFRHGQLEELPVDDRTIDLITCSLALTHVPDLQPVIREFARVTKPGGTVILSDIHPLNTLFGGIAGFPGADLTDGVPYVRNLTHMVSEYITAFADADLRILQCIEPLFSDRQIAGLPSYPVYPDASRQAYGGLPSLLIWQLRRIE
jgi:ubiquinone/menaquinone biosynthesis C-methylase UbiE